MAKKSPRNKRNTTAETTLTERPQQHVPGDGNQQKLFAEWVLNAGFLSAIVLAGIALLLSGIYLFTFLRDSNAAVSSLLAQPEAIPHSEVTPVDTKLIQLGINAQMVMSRLALISCGVFVGMSFGFLGFSLFLLGIKGEMEVEAGSESYSAKIARMSPGAFVILCASILIGVCVTRQTPFSYQTSTRVPSASGNPETSGDDDVTPTRGDEENPFN